MTFNFLKFLAFLPYICHRSNNLQMRLDTKTIFLCLIGLIVLLPANAQYRRNKFNLMDGTRLTPMGGVNAYFGDLVDKSRTSYSFGASFEREMSRVVNARVHLMAGQMKGEQVPDQMYARFENQYIEFGAGATLRLMDLAYGYFRQRTLNPYLIGQIGINYFDATEWYGPAAGNYPDWHPNAGESRDGDIWRTASGITPIITLGGGLSYWLNPRISIRGEFLANQPFSDLMDAHEEWQRGDGTIVKTDDIDFYYTATLGVSIVIQDNRWRNEPKYNRKSYIKIRKYNMQGGQGRSKYKPSRRR
jgi:hypothetical protein